MVFCQTCHSYGFLIGIPNHMVTICRSSPSPYDVKSELIPIKEIFWRLLSKISHKFLTWHDVSITWLYAVLLKSHIISIVSHNLHFHPDKMSNVCVFSLCVNRGANDICLFVFGLIPYSMDMGFKATMWILERQIPHPFLETMTGEKRDITQEGRKRLWMILLIPYGAKKSHPFHPHPEVGDHFGKQDA